VRAKVRVRANVRVRARVRARVTLINKELTEGQAEPQADLNRRSAHDLLRALLGVGVSGRGRGRD
jgi:hypothetical protein